MKHMLSLNNEQAMFVYNFLSKLQLDRVQNRHRWTFLKVLEDGVFDFEKKSNEIVDDINMTVDPVERTKRARSSVDLVKTLRTETKDYSFADRESYAQVQTLYTSNGKDLSGADGRLYTEVEDVFAKATTTE
jgi:hypothetical protein